VTGENSGHRAVFIGKEVHRGSTTKSQVRSICPRRKGQTQAAHVAIAVEDEKNEAYIKVIAKVGVISSNEAYCMGSPRGSIRQGEQDTCGDN
jgi:hypothetical protein